ncbi:CHAT domain-containing protein [Microbacterium sp. NPDC056044]|uniref:CHAT domain-containing protein n=1 Tax=Microbacterium sp. NPDC056044 TaxID=3345690 RepID=UPI0035D5AF13
MALVPDEPRVGIDADDGALEVQLDTAPPGTGPDQTGIVLLADAMLQARAATVATVRVHGSDDFHYAVIVSRDAGVVLVHLEPDGDGDGYSAQVALSRGERVHLSIVASDRETGMAALEERVAQGGMGAGGAEAEMAGPPPDLGDDFGDVLGGGFGGREVGLAPGGRDVLPPAMVEEIQESEPEPEPVAAGPAPAEGGADRPKPAVDGSTPIDVNVAASMPADLYEDVPFDVVVTLSRERILIPKGHAGDAQPVKVRKRGAIRIAVQADGFDIASGTEPSVVAEIPQPGAPNVYTFGLVPGAEGLGRVTVTVTQDPDVMPLAVIPLSTMILAADDAPADAGELRAPVRGEAGAATPPKEVAKLPMIAIEETISRGHSVLKVTAKVGKKRETNTICLLDKAAYVDQIYRDLERIRDTYVTEKKAGVAGETLIAHAEEALRGVGTRIARTLLGDEVNALLWDRRDRMTQLVIQTSGELDIPWEIVHLARVGEAERDDDSHFLGDKGLTRWLWGTTQPTRFTVAAARAVAIAPDYTDAALKLPATQQEVAELRKRLALMPDGPVTRDEVRTRIEAGFDLLHFAGHGRWRDRDPRGQEIALAAFVTAQDDGSAAYSDADAREDLSRRPDAGDAASHPFVFLSACDVGRLQQGATGLGGFAEAFLRGGAGVFIGCSWAVRDDVTAEFATTFYEQLFAGKTLGEAAAAARSAARAHNDLTALAFTVFADPRAQIVVV